MIAGYAQSVVKFRGDLIREIQAAGHEVIVAVPHDEAARDIALQFSSPIVIETYAMARAGRSPVRDLATFFELRRIARRVAPDIVFAYTAKAVIYGLLAARSAGIRHRYALITGLGYAFAESSPRYVRALAASLYSFALRFATVAFFQNPDDERLFRKLGIVAGHQKTTVVHGSGVNIDEFASSPVPEGPTHFAMISRLLLAKGVREYISAARVVREHSPESRCILVGWFDSGPDGVPESEVFNAAAQGWIEFKGRLDDIRPVMHEVGVVVLPTAYPEGTPRTLLEGMAMGRALITTDTPGCRETVADGHNGYLVPVRNSAALANAMLSLVASHETVRAMGENSRQIAEEKYDVRKVNAAMLREMGILAASAPVAAA